MTKPPPIRPRFGWGWITWEVVRRLLLAGTVMGVIGAVALVLLSAFPSQRDLWLVLTAALMAGAIGAWRAELDAAARDRDWRRGVNLDRLNATERYISDAYDYLMQRADAVERGLEIPRSPSVPILADTTLVGDYAALRVWLETTDHLHRRDPSLTPEEGEELGEAMLGIVRAIQLQRERIWRRQEPMRLTKEQANEIGQFVESGWERAKARDGTSEFAGGGHPAHYNVRHE